tara:strand:- start:950 stop:1648 length:699 start_codon:yes stop_codon:yes gene_type:complete
MSTQNDPYVWARDKILERTSPTVAISSFYKSTLRFLLSKFSEFRYLDDEANSFAIKCFFGNKERAIAKITQEDNIILPVMSISQDSSKESEKRRRQSSNLVVTSFWSKEKKRAVRVVSLAPKAVTVSYDLNVWCKYNADLDQISEQVRLLFNPSLTVANDFTETTLAFLEQEGDGKVTSVGDREDRVLRKKFSISVEGYIPFPKFIITSTGEIEEVILDTTILTSNQSVSGL